MNWDDVTSLNISSIFYILKYIIELHVSYLIDVNNWISLLHAMRV